MSGNPNATLEATEEGAAAGSPATHRKSSGRWSQVGWLRGNWLHSGWLSSGWLSGTARRRKGLVGRFGIIVPAIGIAAFLVAIVAVAAYVMSPKGDGAADMATALTGLTHSQQVAVLEQERQEIVIMDAAARTLSTAASPTKVDPDAVIQAANQQSASSSSANNSSSAPNVADVPAPDPGTAEHIGYEMLPSFGFNQTTQWSCLDQLWTRESGWRWDAENPDGAYGIPQAYPGSKMASAGADWQTDPTTQIKWGLTYITDEYGSPCGAWDEELSSGGY